MKAFHWGCVVAGALAASAAVVCAIVGRNEARHAEKIAKEKEWCRGTNIRE